MDINTDKICRRVAQGVADSLAEQDTWLTEQTMEQFNYFVDDLAHFLSKEIVFTRLGDVLSAAVELKDAMKLSRMELEEGAMTREREIRRDSAIERLVVKVLKMEAELE